VADFPELVDDFLNIEVNTIIKDSMSAEKFPAGYPDAVKQILEGYTTYIEDLGSSQLSLEAAIEKFKNEFPVSAPSQRAFNRIWHKIKAAFEALFRRPGERLVETGQGAETKALKPTEPANLTKPIEPLEVLKAAAKELRDEASEKDKSILDRICTNCDSLGQVHAKEVLAISDRLAIRKMWEIGTEHVVIQTCISLGGDVTTRISSDLVTRDAEIRDMLLNAHRESTSISLAHWKSLLDAISAIAGKK
jgi:hypothetical protein